MACQISLLDVFISRPKRFELLKRGLELAGANENSRMLESGSAVGDGAAFVCEQFGAACDGIEICQNLVDEANARHADAVKSGKVRYFQDDAQQPKLPYKNYDIVFCEAAYSPIADKLSAVRAFRNMLTPGGKVLVNDFATHNEVADEIRRGVSFVPCFSGVETMDRYIEEFESCGFRKTHASWEPSEFVSIALWVRKQLNVPPEELGKGFVSAHDKEGDEAKTDFFKKAQMSYCQLIFEKC